MSCDSRGRDWSEASARDGWQLPRGLRGGKEVLFPTHFSRSTASLTPSFQTSRLQNCGRLNLCGFKPFDLWYFVIKVLGNQYTIHLPSFILCKQVIISRSHAKVFNLLSHIHFENFGQSLPLSLYPSKPLADDMGSGNTRRQPLTMALFKLMKDSLQGQKWNSTHLHSLKWHYSIIMQKIIIGFCNLCLAHYWMNEWMQ